MICMYVHVMCGKCYGMSSIFTYVRTYSYRPSLFIGVVGGQLYALDSLAVELNIIFEVYISTYMHMHAHAWLLHGKYVNWRQIKIALCNTYIVYHYTKLIVKKKKRLTVET